MRASSERVAIVGGAGGELGRATAEKVAAGGVTRGLDLELRPLGIRVNAVAPQQLDTAETHPCLTPDLLAHGVTPGAVAGLIVYLVSDATAAVSGAIVPAYGA